jgi:hypothetical protein
MENQSILGRIEQLQDASGFRDLHWEGTFEDYLGLVKQDPKIARSAYMKITPRCARAWCTTSFSTTPLSTAKMPFLDWTGR